MKGTAIGSQTNVGGPATTLIEQCVMELTAGNSRKSARRNAPPSDYETSVKDGTICVIMCSVCFSCSNKQPI